MLEWQVWITMTELATVPFSGKPFPHFPAPTHPVLEPQRFCSWGMLGCRDARILDAGFRMQDTYLPWRAWVVFRRTLELPLELKFHFRVCTSEGQGGQPQAVPVSSSR